jgi:hypothetical protein
MALAKGASATVLSNKTAAAAGATTISECTTIDTDAATKLALTVKLTYGSAATLVPTIKLWASEDDINWDTELYESYDFPKCTASGTLKWTLDVGDGPRYIKIQVVNNESAGSNKDITAIYVYTHKQAVS